MNNLKSEYELDLIVKNDKSKDAIQVIEKGFKALGDTVKKGTIGKDLTKSLEESQHAAQEMIDQFHQMASDSELDFKSISDAYSKNSKKAIAELEKQYSTIRDAQKSIIAQEKELNDLKAAGADQSELIEAQTKLAKLYEEQHISSIAELDARIKQNRQIRANLKAAGQTAMFERASAKLKELQTKRNTASSKKEKKALDEQIKQQQSLYRAVEQGKKAYEANEKVIKANAKAVQEVIVKQNALQKVLKAGTSISQLAYNMSGMIGGAARTGKTVVNAGMGIARAIGSGISAVASGADQEIERERQANRVKGMPNEEAKTLLRNINVQTGADYSTIVDAINRVQGTLGRNLNPGELAQAAELELRYPGMSTAFASQSGTNEAGVTGYRQYAAKLNAIQKVTGASADQIAASTQAFANRKDIKMAGGSVSDYQAVYLAMQNSGAFDTEEELDAVFKKFVQKQSASGKGVFEFAKDFKMADYVSDARNKLQAQTADRNMDWGKFAADLKANESNESGPSQAESLAIKMREMEDKKNQLLMKLIPAVFPIVEKIANLITSPDGEKIVDGLVSLFETVIPMLEPIFTALGAFLSFMSNTILPKFQWIIEQAGKFFSKFIGGDSEDALATPQYAAGGFTLIPSIVGERGPEAIIPLDYSRAQRADNIATSITQTFNMGSGATTALSLAQAVRSRDFTRAMAENAYISKRCGVF